MRTIFDADRIIIQFSSENEREEFLESELAKQLISWKSTAPVPKRLKDMNFQERWKEYGKNEAAPSYPVEEIKLPNKYPCEIRPQDYPCDFNPEDFPCQPDEDKKWKIKFPDYNTSAVKWSEFLVSNDSTTTTTTANKKRKNG